MSKTIADALGSIRAVDERLLKEADKRLDNLTKPRGSLGRLEEFAARLYAIGGGAPPAVSRKIVFTFAADHGVADEGVSAFPKEVTAQMVYNFLRGGAGINVLARQAGAEVKVVDVGVAHDFKNAEGLISRKVVSGSRNMRRGPAMTKKEAEACVEVGISLALEHAAPGVVYGTGEMGIANTTPASALAALFTGRRVEEVTGRGTGIDDAVYANKVAVIEEALSVNKPDAKDPLGALAAVGGPEIAAIAGLVIGAAARRVPVVVDGFISTAGALAAFEMSPLVKGYLFAAHKSVERGHALMLDRMGLRPIVDLDMRLGEGTGAALAMMLVEAGARIYNEMATFGDAGVTEGGVEVERGG